MKKVTVIFAVIALMISTNLFAQKDIPYIPKFKDSKISWQQGKKFDRYFILFFKPDKISDTITVEGKITRTQYEVGDGHSVFEIYKSYETALKNSGFQFLNYIDEKSGYTGPVNERLYNWELGGINPLPKDAISTRYRDHYTYFVAKKNIDNKDVYAVIFISEIDKPLITVDLIEEKSLEDNMIMAQNTNNKTEKQDLNTTNANNTQDNKQVLTNYNTNKKNNYKKFEIEILANYWLPFSSHLKATNIVVYDDTNPPNPYISGYGRSLFPAGYFSYFFKENIGITIGLDLIHANNKIDLSGNNAVTLENDAEIDCIELGLTGRTISNENFSIYYGFGTQFVTNYYLSQHVSNQPDVDATDYGDIGIYFRAGSRFKIYKNLYFKSYIQFNSINVQLNYSNSGNLHYDEETDLGGLGLMFGLSYNFL